MDFGTPAYLGEIHVLVTAFERNYETPEEAINSIRTNALGQGDPGLCLPLKEFPKAESTVYRGGK